MEAPRQKREIIFDKLDAHQVESGESMLRADLKAVTEKMQRAQALMDRLSERDRTAEESQQYYDAITVLENSSHEKAVIEERLANIAVFEDAPENTIKNKLN